MRALARRFLPAILTLALLFWGASTARAWVVRDMSVEIAVARDSSLEVRESIEVDFGSEQRHGIYREIPLRESSRTGAGRRIRVRVRNVTDGAGGVRMYRARRAGRYLSIRIGDPAVFVTGVQRYVIRYRVDNALLFFPDHVELYWNATGNEWPVGINQASCSVRLPEAPDGRRLQVNAWIGPAGSTERAEFELSENTVVFRSPRPLGYAEGLTVALGWPHGLVHQPAAVRRLLWFLSDRPYVLLPLLVVAALTVVWLLYGRDPDPGRPVAVCYEPPGGLRPAEVGALVDERVDTRDITATVVDLAARGYLTIEEGPPAGLFGSRSYTLRKRPDAGERDPRGQLAPYERTLFDKMFATGDSVTLEGLRSRFYTAAEMASGQIYSSLTRKGLFYGRPDRVRQRWRAGGWMVCVAGIFGLFLTLDEGIASLQIEPGWALAILLSGLAVVAFSPLMPRKTPAGKRAALDALGFEEYLSRAEKEDLELQEKRGIFERFLPYAVSLKVVERWARAFEGIVERPPEWFTASGDGGRFYAVHFARSLDSACSSLGAAMTSAPRSASGGASAFGGFGGGFSGGGFGGGGGRAW
jgi:hypothetical protein